jgi:hypothetical protein
MLLLDENFNYSIKINSLIKLEKWMKRYFEEELPILENLYIQKTAKSDTFTFAYINNFNRSLKLSSNLYNKKTKSIEKDKMDLITNIFKTNFNLNHSSIMKIKGSYIYFLTSGERKVAVLLGDNLSLTALNNSIEEMKKELFDYIFIL